jgi:HAD superfamily hydrolase (TIGR01490 family)
MRGKRDANLNLKKSQCEKSVMSVMSPTYVKIPSEAQALGAKTYLPEGIVPVTERALGASRLMQQPLALNEEGKVQVAAFDFDGTCISGNSPVLLVQHLIRMRKLSPSVIARIAGWAFCYKTRLPQSESWVRELVFRAFAGQPVEEVNSFLANFYHTSIDKRFRPLAQECMNEHIEAGHAVVCVSATFEPLIAAAMTCRPLQYSLSTRMHIDFEGCYVNQVEGQPIEGEEKVNALNAMCDTLFGGGKWELTWAYGDHHSDRSLLAAAKQAFAVTPDRPLTRTAQTQGYTILEW